MTSIKPQTRPRSHVPFTRAQDREITRWLRPLVSELGPMLRTEIGLQTTVANSFQAFSASFCSTSPLSPTQFPRTVCWVLGDHDGGLGGFATYEGM